MAKLADLNIGDKFQLRKEWEGFDSDAVFVFSGRTDVFVYGPNFFDVYEEHDEDEIFIMENQEVFPC